MLFLHSAHLWLTAREAESRALAAVAGDPASLPSDSTVAILLSAASTEAFINELAECVSQSSLADLSSELRNFASVLGEVESSRGSLNLKYLLAAQTLSGSAFDKGSNPFQDFATLVTLRNDLMHLKPRDKITSVAPGAVVEVPKYVVGLQQRGLARTPPAGDMLSWFNRLQTAEMATWSTETAQAIILAVLAMIPDMPNSAGDPSFGFKSLFRNQPLVGEGS